MEVRQNLLQALNNSLVGNTQTITQSAQTLQLMSNNNGFCMALMEITDHPDIKIYVKQAALVQLKNTIKSRWRHQNPDVSLSECQRTKIKNSIIMAMIRCTKNPQIIKLYREILCIIVGFEYRQWLPLNELIANLQANSSLPALLHIILGICTSFERTPKQNAKNIFIEFAKGILPPLLSSLQNNMHDSEAIYLSLKVLWKSTHYILSLDIRMLAVSWMQLLYIVINSYNQEMQQKISDFQGKNTQQFFYFHAKKWATRIILSFIQRHARQQIVGQPKGLNLQFSKNWHTSFGEKFIMLIYKQLEIPTIKKVRYFQLKSLQSYINEKPEKMFDLIRDLQYRLLIPFIELNHQNHELATTDVIQYLRSQDQYNILNFTNTKKAATDLWITCSQIYSKANIATLDYQPGPLFNENFQFIVAKIQSSNIKQKQFGLYLFCELKSIINKVESTKGQIIPIITQYVIPELRSQEILMRSRANQVFIQYGNEKMGFEILKEAAERIYECFLNDPSPLVNITAASAFQYIISHAQVKDLVAAHLSQILQRYLYLIKKYDLEQIVFSLEVIISDFNERISPFAVNLFKYLSDTFIDMFNRENQPTKKQAESELILAASGCLKTLTQILETPINQGALSQIEPYFIDICNAIFSKKFDQFTEDVMELMNAYLYKINKISERVLFFFQILVYYTVGMTEVIWQQICQSPIPEQQRKIFSLTCNTENVEYLACVMPVLRNYISKSYAVIELKDPLNGTKFLQMFFYLISGVYKSFISPNNDVNQIELSCATCLMIYLIERYPVQFIKPVIPNIWQYVRFNISKASGYNLKTINQQLLLTLFWKHYQNIVKLLLDQPETVIAEMAKSAKMTDEAVKNKLKSEYINSFEIIKKYSLKLQEEHQRKRAILCFSHLLLIAPSSQNSYLLDQVPFIFQTLLKLIKANSKSRIYHVYRESQYQQKLKEQLSLYRTQKNSQQALYEDFPNNGDNGDESQENASEDEDDYWEEQYKDRFESPIGNLDELRVFQQTMAEISQSSPEYSQQIISLVPEQVIKRVSGFLERSLHLAEQRKLHQEQTRTTNV